MTTKNTNPNISLEEYLKLSIEKQTEIRRLFDTQDCFFTLRDKLTGSNKFKNLLAKHLKLVKRFSEKNLYVNIRIRFNFIDYEDGYDNPTDSVCLDYEYSDNILKLNPVFKTHCKAFEKSRKESIDKLVAILESLKLSYSEATSLIFTELDKASI